MWPRISVADGAPVKHATVHALARPRPSPRPSSTSHRNARSAAEYLPVVGGGAPAWRYSGTDSSSAAAHTSSYSGSSR